MWRSQRSIIQKPTSSSTGRLLLPKVSSPCCPRCLEESGLLGNPRSSIVGVAVVAAEPREPVSRSFRSRSFSSLRCLSRSRSLSLSLSLSLYIPSYISLYSLLYLSLSLSIFLSLCHRLSISLYISLSLCLFFLSYGLGYGLGLSLRLILSRSYLLFILDPTRMNIISN